MDQENVALNDILVFKRIAKAGSYSGGDDLTPIDCASCNLISAKVIGQEIELIGKKKKKGKDYEFSIRIREDKKNDYSNLWPVISDQINKVLGRSIKKNINLIYSELENIKLKELIK